MSNESTASFTGELDRAERDGVPCLMLGMQRGCAVAPAGLFVLRDCREVLLLRGNHRTTCLRKERDVLIVEMADSWMSSPHARMVRQSSGEWRLQDLQSKNGSHVNGVPVETTLLHDGDLIDVGSSFLVLRHHVPVSLIGELEAGAARGEIAGTLSAELHNMLGDLERVARSKLPVLIAGETGTGKEIAARKVHAGSGRRGPFLAVNCASIASSLAESELFGYVKGAFSGATDERPGLVRASHGGTLFLDEVAELDRSTQSKLLRVLQQEEVLPVGATRPVPVDLRVISASCRDLDQIVATGAFREDLLARLAGYRATMPALRDRREDLGHLVKNLLEECLPGRAAEVRLRRDVVRALYLYDWPRNIRQLKHTLQAAVALNPALEIGLEHLPAEFRQLEAQASTAEDVTAPDEPLRKQLVELLTMHQGNVSAVARALCKARVQVRRWCHRFGLEPESFREQS